MITQIYEIKNDAEAHMVNNIGVTHAGIWVEQNVQQGQTALSFEEGKRIVSKLNSDVKSTVLTLSADIEAISSIVENVRPDILHLGGSPEKVSLALTTLVKLRHPTTLIMSSIPVLSEDSIKLALSYAELADFILLDSYDAVNDNFGCTGESHDWSISSSIVEQCSKPVILAGGLGPDNVAAAIRAVNPAGVDSKSKTDLKTSMFKDPEAVRAFVLNSKQNK